MRLVPSAVLLLLAAVAGCSGCSKSAESKEGGVASAEAPVAAKGSAQEPGPGSAGQPEQVAGADGSATADPADPVAQDQGAGKKPPKKEVKGPGGAPATKTSWEVVDPNGTRHGADGSFQLAIAETSSVAAGAEAAFKLTVTPGSGYKINYCEPGEADCNDFPVSLKLTETEGVKLPKAALARGDVTAIDKHQLVLEFKAIPNAAGSYTVPGKFKFAVCQADACLPRRLDMWFVLAAK